jgi:hypothetical protein
MTREERVYSGRNFLSKLGLVKSKDETRALTILKELKRCHLGLFKITNSLVHSNVHTIGRELTQAERVNHADAFKHTNIEVANLNKELSSLDQTAVSKVKQSNSELLAEIEWLRRGHNRHIDSVPGMRKHMPK